MAAKKKVDGRTKEGRALKARRAASLKDDPKPKGRRVPNAKRGGRPVGGRLPKLGDVVRILRGGEKHALGTIGNEDGKHWIVFEDRSNVGIRVRKSSVRLATLDERHIHARKLVAIDVALTTFQNGDYERDDVPTDDTEEVVWDDGAFPASVAAEWGLTKDENIEVAKLLVEAHGKHEGKPYSGEVTFRLSTGKQISLNHEADTPDDEAGFHFSYKPLSVVDVGHESEQTKLLEEEEDEDEGDDEPATFALPNVVDGRDTSAAQSLLGD